MVPNYKGEVIKHDVAKYVPETEYVVKVLERHVEKAKHNLKGAPIVVAGGFVLKYFIKSLAVKAESFYIPKYETDKEPFTNSR